MLDPARGRFYATHHLDSTVGIYDLASGDLLKTLPTAGGPYGIALDAGRGRLYTADRDGPSVTIIDTAGDSVIKHMPLNCAPYQVAVNPASGHLFVVCAGERQMHIYDVETTRWLAWVPVGRGAQEGIAVDRCDRPGLRQQRRRRHGERLPGQRPDDPADAAAHAYTHDHPHGNRHTVADRHANDDIDADGHAHADMDTYPDIFSDAHGAADADGHPHPHAVAARCAGYL